MPVLGTRSFVMKVRSRQGVEKLAIGTKGRHTWVDFLPIYRLQTQMNTGENLVN